MESNKRVKSEYVQIDDESISSEALRTYLTINDAITAVFCADDYIATNMYYAAEGLGKKIPKDLSIIGFTDNKILEFLPLKMTTVRQPVEELCTKAVEILINKITDSDASTQTIKIKTEVIERSSVAPFVNDI
jgi:DNA-binding LacI/PurR family transcriptional regulator